MKFQSSTGSLPNEKSSLLAWGVNKDFADSANFKWLDKQFDEELSVLAEEENFEGKEGQVLSYRFGEGRRLVLIGMGDKDSIRARQLQDYGARVIGQASKRGLDTVSIAMPSGKIKGADAAQHIVEGTKMGSYKFDRYLTKNKSKELPSSVRVLADLRGRKKPSINSGVKRGSAVADSVCMARDLVNTPAEDMAPADLAKAATSLARKHKMTIKVMTAAECKKMGMGMYLAVGQGSDKPPKFIHMTYKPKRKATKKIVLVGKGVTFDSGGYSLKPSASMLNMKIDMGGSAAVISAMGAVAELGSKYEIHAIVAACENLVSGKAYKLGDVLTSMDGTTVEINNTDAEGRLTLGDALTYARTKIKPDEMFDFATLTGACMVALGPYTGGVFSDDAGLKKAWMSSADSAGEEMWEMPLNKRLRSQLKSNIADMKNTGERYGGAITAGLFLQTFVKDVPWLHVDLAGPASASSATPSIPRGGTGFAVATIVDYLTK